ncbi:unnamed protein product [Acanthosepion pharaonis]|uniref:Uncharacterized protein n=1 Tax=Acanthosepion pharaonis TaxID=158019 RepID=A0A812CE87_ACAPH|nr:unnamed protein product [Sepia pharaonis]
MFTFFLSTCFLCFFNLFLFFLSLSFSPFLSLTIIHSFPNNVVCLIFHVSVIFLILSFSHSFPLSFSLFLILFLFLSLILSLSFFLSFFFSLSHSFSLSLSQSNVFSLSCLPCSFLFSVFSYQLCSFVCILSFHIKRLSSFLSLLQGVGETLHSFYSIFYIISLSLFFLYFPPPPISWRIGKFSRDNTNVIKLLSINLCSLSVYLWSLSIYLSIYLSGELSISFCPYLSIAFYLSHSAHIYLFRWTFLLDFH